MGGSCVVHGCANSVATGHRMKAFPRDPKRRATWERRIERKARHSSKFSRICEAHFDESQWELRRADGIRRLKWNAIPTLLTGREQRRSESKAILVPETEADLDCVPPAKLASVRSSTTIKTGSSARTMSSKRGNGVRKRRTPSDKNSDSCVVAAVAAYKNDRAGFIICPDVETNSATNTDHRYTKTVRCAPDRPTKSASHSPPDVCGYKMLLAKNRSRLDEKRTRRVERFKPRQCKPMQLLVEDASKLAERRHGPSIESGSMAVAEFRTVLDKRKNASAAFGERLAEKDDELRELRQQLTAHASLLADKCRQLDDNEKLLAEKSRLLAEKDKLLGDKTVEIAEKDIRIFKREKLLAKLERQIAEFRKKDSARRVEKHRDGKRCAALEDNLRKVFGEDQIVALGRSSMQFAKWSPETVCKAMALKRELGTGGYKKLLQLNLPFPSVRTLQRKLRHPPKGDDLLGEFEKACGLDCDDDDADADDDDGDADADADALSFDIKFQEEICDPIDNLTSIQLTMVGLPRAKS